MTRVRNRGAGYRRGEKHHKAKMTEELGIQFVIYTNRADYQFGKVVRL